MMTGVMEDITRVVIV